MEHLPGLSCRAEGQLCEVSLIGCHAVKARMRASFIVELQIAADRSACIADALIGSQIYLLVFDGAPQPLDEHIVRQAPLPSMLIAMLCLVRTPVKAEPVNCEPDRY